MYGPAQSAAITDSLVALAEAMRRGEPAPGAGPLRPAQRGRARRRAVRQRAPRAARSLAQPRDVPPRAQAVVSVAGRPARARPAPRPALHRDPAALGQALAPGRRRPRAVDRLDRRRRRRATTCTGRCRGARSPAPLPGRGHRQQLPPALAPASRSTAAAPAAGHRPDPPGVGVRADHQPLTLTLRAKPNLADFSTLVQRPTRPRFPRLGSRTMLDVDRGPPSGAAAR